MERRIFITGLGVTSCVGIGKECFWSNLIQGNTGISRINSFDVSRHRNHYGGEVKGVNFGNYINKDYISLGRSSKLAIIAAKLALEDAGLEADKLNKEDIGIFLGTTGGESQSIEDIDDTWVEKGLDKVSLDDVMNYIPPNIARNVSRYFRFKGINKVFGTACAAGNYAIGCLYDLMKKGNLDIGIAGGVDSLSRIMFSGFDKLGAVASYKCRPFDKNREGMIPAEGAGILVLESLEHALKRGAFIYADILGYGLSCDAYHMTAPSVEGVSNCMFNALADANLSGDEVDYINAHGTGTIINDRIECTAIRKVFGKRYKDIPVSSIKSMLGHSMGASSALETVACCMTINEGILPPTINYQTPDPECDIDCVPNIARKSKVNIVMNNSYAFGGNNCCLILGRYDN